MKGNESNRHTGIDIIKSLAILLVICVHFSLNTNYYATPISNINMYIQTIIRYISVICVPLFIISTGFLNYQKSISKSYYLKISRILIPYLIISIICLVIKEYKSPNPIDWKNDIFSIFDFTANPYSWYVNMFIGLYLIAPFFNIIFKHLDRKKHLYFIGILIFVISLPLTFNPIFISSSEFSYFYFPDFWMSIYPIIYYCIGAYIAMYNPKVKKVFCFTAAFTLCLLQTAILIFAQPFLEDNWLLFDFGSIFIIAESVCIFLIFYNTNIRYKPVRMLFVFITSVTLETYLFSYIVDTHVYPYFYSLSSGISQEMFFSRYFAIIVPIVFLLSFVLAYIFRFINKQLSHLIKCAVQRKKLLL